MSGMKYISFTSLNFPEHLHIRHPQKIIIIKIWMIYFSSSLSWNPFIHFLHTIHIIPPSDIVTGWPILCLIFFLRTIQASVKQEQRSPHSWCHYTNFQKGTAPLSSPLQWPSGFIIAWRPGTLPPIFGFLDAFRVNDYLLHPRQHSLTTCHPLLSIPTQSLDKWNIITFYILNHPPTTTHQAPFLSLSLVGRYGTVLLDSGADNSFICPSLVRC